MLKQNTAPSPALDITAIGLDESGEQFLRAVTRVFAEYYECRLTYRGEVTAESVTQLLGANLSSTLYFVDIDSDAGRSAWYTLRAMHGNDTVAVLASDPTDVKARHMFAKPLRAKPLLQFIKTAASSG